jgi:hypothetical protein
LLEILRGERVVWFYPNFGGSEDSYTAQALFMGFYFIFNFEMFMSFCLVIKA